MLWRLHLCVCVFISVVFLYIFSAAAAKADRTEFECFWNSSNAELICAKAIYEGDYAQNLLIAIIIGVRKAANILCQIQQVICILSRCVSASVSVSVSDFSWHFVFGFDHSIQAFNRVKVMCFRISDANKNTNLHTNWI